MIFVIVIGIILALGSVLAVATAVDSGEDSAFTETPTPFELTFTPTPEPTVEVTFTPTPEPTVEVTDVPTPEPTVVVELSPTPADLPDTGGQQ